MLCKGMAANTQKLAAPVRRARIREMLRENQQVSISGLASVFGVSEMTVRRDLDTLANNGELRRTHGGAVPAERLVLEFDFAQRRQNHRQAKMAIAVEALKLTKPGHRIILDTGTTTLELAYLLKNSRDITVITPSLAAASVLQFFPGVETIILGGVMREGNPDLTGAVTERTLDMFAADIAFLGADGIGLDGTLYTEDIRIARVDEKIRQISERTYVLADSSKIARTALSTNGLLNEVDALITDDKITDEHRQALEKTGARLIMVSLDNS